MGRGWFGMMVWDDGLGTTSKQQASLFSFYFLLIFVLIEFNPNLIPIQS